MTDPKVSIILPSQNEKTSIGQCLKEIKKTIKENNIAGEIIVSDSSKDGTDKIAKQEGATVIKHDLDGYGIAIKKGMEYARGEIIIYADADGTYSFKEIPGFLKELNNADIIIGNRFAGTIETGAMPPLHRFFGTPLLNLLLRILFGIKISDSQSGYRAFKKEIFNNLNLKTKGMELATEMIIKAKKMKLKIKEIPINYYCRKGTSKLRPYQDGLAHLKYILMQTPLALYFTAGGILLIIGLVGLVFGQNTGNFLNSATVKILFPFLGIQTLFLGLFAKTYLYTEFEEKIDFIRKFYAIFRLKLAIGLGLFLILIPAFFKLLGASAEFFDPLLVLTIIGLQIIFNSIILSSLSIK